MNRTVRAILFVVGSASIGSYARFHYLACHPVELIPYQSSIKQLSADITRLCIEKNFKGAIPEIKSVKGPQDDPFLENLIVHELTAQLLSANATQLTIIVPPQEYEAKVRDIKRQLEDRGVDPGKIAEIIRGKTEKVKKVADYEIDLNWLWFDRANQIVKLDFVLSGTESLAASAQFTHPKFAQEYAQKLADYAVAERVSGALAILLFLILLADSIMLLLGRRRLMRDWPGTVEQLNRLVNSGSYYAASSLGKKCLAVSPGNAELIAFMERLSHITKNDPRRADRAYLKYLSLRSKADSKVDLAREEFEELKKILGFIEHPGITAFAAQYEQYYSSVEAAAAIKSRRQAISGLMRAGELSKAGEEYKALSGEPGYVERQGQAAGTNLLEGPDNYESLEAELEKRRGKLAGEMKAVKKCISGGDIQMAEVALSRVAAIDKASAQEINAKIFTSRKADKLCLVSLAIGKPAVVFKKSMIAIFRRDAKVPDIDIQNDRVSRDSHLTIHIIDNKVIAEDSGTPNGTFIGGNRISRSQIEDGDIIDVARAYRMTAHICRGPAGKHNINALFLEAEDKDYIVLADSITVTFKPTGLACDEGGDCRFTLNSGVVLFGSREATVIVAPGEILECRGNRYKVETA
jgi:hypothetical protein